MANDVTVTCGMGIAQHATIPAKIGVMFEGLAETLELHRRMLVPSDPRSEKEDQVYRELAASWRHIAALVRRTAAAMAAQEDLPMGVHDQAAWTGDHVRAFEKFVHAQSELLALLRISAERDEQMLAGMTS